MLEWIEQDAADIDWLRGNGSIEEKADRRVRDPEYWGVPYGTPIVPGMKPAPRQLELPGMPSPVSIAPATNDATRAERREVSLVGYAREQADEIERLIRYININGFTEDAGKIERQLIYDYGLGGYENTYQSAYVSGGDWQMFGGARDIRKAAYNILGYDIEEEEENIADPHLMSQEDPGYGQGTFEAVAPYGVAYGILRQINEAEPVDIPLWRGVELYSYTNAKRFIEELKKDDTFDLPIASFAGRRRDSERFGDSVIFRVQKGAKAIQGGFMGYDEDDDKAYPHDSLEMSEVVTGGRFKVTNVSEDRQGRFVVSIRQIATFDPETGLATKKPNRRWKYAYLFDNSLRAGKLLPTTNAAEVLLRTKAMLEDVLEDKGVRRVRTPAGVEHFGLPIGAIIGSGKPDVAIRMPDGSEMLTVNEHAVKAAKKLKSFKRIPTFKFSNSEGGGLEATDEKTGYKAKIEGHSSHGSPVSKDFQKPFYKLTVTSGDTVVYEEIANNNEVGKTRLARRAQFEMKRPYIAALNEKSKKGKRKSPGFQDLYQGRYGVDWSEDGPGFVSEDDIDGRWAAALAESQELGIDYVQRVGSSNEIHFESIETINSVMRVHEEIMPGLLSYIPKIGVRPQPARRAIAYNVMIKGSPEDRGWLYGRDRYANAFLDPNIDYEYTAIGLSKKYFASDWDEAQAYDLLKRGTDDWWTVDPKKFAEEAGIEDWEGLIFSVMTHEIGHTVGRTVTGFLRSAQGDEYQHKLSKEFYEGLTDIFEEFGLIVEGERIPPSSGLLRVETTLLRELLSEYGTTNIQEMLAEIWAEYVIAERPRPFAQKVGDLMSELMQDWIDHEFEGYES